ncbi:hypothetical protein M8009_17480 [Halomonas sp. ATCH28]|uniref:Tyr recombinase domain-containing protein n=1 Tax=Halomonas gemina TaxID=2945105 RepID=A0ABT0T5B1_9GAMM|nr:hypothetical protein [Halomonas gemina]MCL7942078.1 hypothetical protein [Halomonas gemina]
MSVWRNYISDYGLESNLIPDHPDLIHKKGNDFAISRGADGSVLSCYGDDSWILLDSSRGSVKLNFDGWSDKRSSNDRLYEKIKSEMKVIVFAQIYYHDKQRVANTIRIDVMRRLGRLAFTLNVTISELLSQKENWDAIIISYAEAARSVKKRILRLLKELVFYTSNDKLLGFEGCYEHLLELVCILEKDFQETAENGDYESRTPLIPTRIYGELIKIIDYRINCALPMIGSIVDLYRRKYKSGEPKYFGAVKRVFRTKFATTWEEEVFRSGLTHYFEEKGISNWDELKWYVDELKFEAIYWIMLFSGMRLGEALKLPSNCFYKVSTEAGETCLIKGYTHKTIGGGQLANAKWITIDIVEKAVKVQLGVAEITGLESNYELSSFPSDDYPLFPMRIKKNASESTWVYPLAPTLPKISRARTRTWLENHKQLIVTDKDLDELNSFMAFRDWGEKSIELGKPWPLSPHQCRRSLAVYAAKSGLVSIGTLKNQFKHLTKEMTLYYQQRSAWAKNFLTSDNNEDLAIHESQLSFIKDLEAQRRITDFLSFEKEVIDSNSRLWGPEGKRIQQSKDKGKPLVIVTDRSATLKRFKQGEMTYKQGPFGGCTNPEPCVKLSLTVIAECVSCKWAINNDETFTKLYKSIVRLQRQRDCFPSGSHHHQQLTDEIKKIKEIIDTNSNAEDSSV